MKRLGRDTDGITQISLDALKLLKEEGYKLEVVRIYGTTTMDISSVFFFGKNLEYFYVASGFSIGYGGEGPHGLWKAIRLWHPDKLGEDFWKTGISQLSTENDWTWSPEKGWEVIISNG
jgi:hypothetical protein